MNEAMKIDELKRIADVLLGAAYADGLHQLEEASAIRRLLGGLAGAEELPPALAQHIEAFDVSAFTLERSCAGLDVDTPEKRRRLLQLVAQVTECDEVHDFDESDYIVRFARCIGAKPEEYKGLTVDVQYDDPPPVPEDD
jgi:uncharacterized tellurite resistance protein B-like protein